MSINTKPKDQSELHATLESMKSALDDIRATPADPTKHEAFVKAAGDLEAAQAHLLKIEKDATLALELAKDLAATGPAKGATALGLKHLPLLYSPEKDPEMKALFGKNVAHFNLLLLTRADMIGLDEDVVKRVERFQYLNDQLVTMHALKLGQKVDPRNRYIEAGGMKSLPLWSEWVALSREFRAAMDTAESGAGAEWAPTTVNLGTLIGDVRPEHQSRNQIQLYSMTRSPQMFMVQGSAFRGFLLDQATDVHRSATVIGQRRTATANVTFTAVKIGALTDISSELIEDGLPNVATQVRVDHAYANGESLESALWNGQRSAITGASSSFDGGTFEDATNADDDRGAWDGWRYLYNAGSCTTPGDAGAGLIADMFTDQFGAMGRFGYNPADQFIGTSFLGAAKLLVLRDSANQNVVLTSEKAGGRGTFATGILYQAFGRNVVVSTQYPQNMTSAGIVDAAGTKTGYHIVCGRRFGLGEVRLLNIQASDQVAFDTDQIVVRSTWRGQMKPYVTPNSTTQVTIGAILNV